MQGDDAARWGAGVDRLVERPGHQAMLAQYREDVRFESSIAELVTGSALIEGIARHDCRRYVRGFP
jgi:hypothetical protein